MSKVKSSPDRHTFQKKSYLKKLEEDPNDSDAMDWIEWIDNLKQEEKNRINDPEWQKDNLEYDLRTSDWIAEKCQDEVYAQNLYAALCNNEFTKNEVWPILTEKKWSCSWRYAGGIVADITQEGDYIDWYCSGIRDLPDVDEDEFEDLSNEDKARFLRAKAFISEGLVTDEIRKDLLILGWIVIEEN